LVAGSPRWTFVDLICCCCHAFAPSAFPGSLRGTRGPSLRARDHCRDCHLEPRNSASSARAPARAPCSPQHPASTPCQTAARGWRLVRKGTPGRRGNRTHPGPTFFSSVRSCLRHSTTRRVLVRCSHALRPAWHHAVFPCGLLLLTTLRAAFDRNGAYATSEMPPSSRTVGQPLLCFRAACRRRWHTDGERRRRRHGQPCVRHRQR
jgi:hypothetical protein